MGLSSLRVENLRCIGQAALEFGPGRNLIVGPNGAGKTTLLEGIHLLGRGRSFRTRFARGVVRSGTAGFSIFGASVDGQGPGGMRRLGIGFDGTTLAGRVDGTTVASLADLARALPVHVIEPRLHDLIEAGPSERRRFVDAGVFHVEHAYLGHWRAYRRALGQRNAALKSGMAGLESWDRALLEAGLAVDGLRRRYCEALGVAVGAIGQRLLRQAVAVEYSPGWRQGLSLQEALQRSRERDRATGLTQVGPHRADLRIRFEIGAVRDSASRGQQKLVAAALVLGQVAELKRLTGQTGTLLIDDPAAELDEASLAALLGEVAALGTQSVITGLRAEPLQRQSGEPVFHVEQGTFRSVVY